MLRITRYLAIVATLAVAVATNILSVERQRHSGPTHALVALASLATPHAYVVPKRIDSTGKKNVTKQLNRFFASVPSNSVVSFRRDARYRVEGTLTLADKVLLTLRGRHATLYATRKGTRNRSHISLLGGEDIVIRDLRIVGANRNPGPDGNYVPGLEAQHGLEVLGTQRLWVDGLNVKNVYGDFVYLGREQRSHSPGYLQPARDVTIENLVGKGSGRQGVSITNAERVLIRNSHLEEIRRSVFDFEPNTAPETVTDVTISNNSAGSARLNFVASGGSGTVKNIVISENSLTGKTMNAMVKGGDGAVRQNWSFLGNQSDRPFGSPLLGAVVANNVEAIEFSNNVQPMQPNRNMVGLRATGLTCGAVYENNILENAVAQGSGGQLPCASGVTLQPVAAPNPPGQVDV